MTNSEITDEGLLIYKKIFFRQLKQIGLYNVIKEENFHNKNTSFSDYIRVDKGTSDVINSAVDVLWNVVEHITHFRLKASLFLILVLTDERFASIFTESKNCNFVEKEIDTMIGKEISYMTSVNDSDWKLFELNDALLFLDFLKNYKNGYFVNHSGLRYKFDYVEGFKHEYWPKK